MSPVAMSNTRDGDRNTAEARDANNVDVPIHTERHLRVLCIGAGASGLAFAYKLLRSFQNIELTVYDKNADAGGTWTENRYPGCACDVPSHTYTFSFWPNPDFSQTYSTSSQIRDYFQRFARDTGVASHLKLRHQVKEAVWDDEAGLWRLRIHDIASGEVIEDHCNILFNASGYLNEWAWPKVPDRDLFEGKLMHTAHWDEDFDLSGKRVGLVGNGSSGIQVLPVIQKEVESVTTFIRSPTWVAPPFGTEPARAYTDEEREGFMRDPDSLTKFRKAQEGAINKSYGIYQKNSQMHKDITVSMRKVMRERLQDDELAKKLIPDWSVGCRRLTPGEGYLEALREPNVRIVHGGVEKFTRTGCIDDKGESHDFDVIVCATGFDVAYRPRFPIIGLGGINLQDLWNPDPRGYLATAAPSMPNYLITLGPNAPIANGPVLSAVEAQAEYALRFIDRYQTEHIHSFVPKTAAIEDFNKHVDEYMLKSVWGEDCRSWYKNHQTGGRVTAVWPGSTLHFLEAMREPRYEDWDFTYRGNRFAFLGTGFSQVEQDDEADPAWYICGATDENEFASRRRRRQVLTRPGGSNGSHARIRL